MNLGFGSGCRLASKPEPRPAAASRLMISRPDHDGRKPARIRRAGPRGVAFFRRPGAGAAGPAAGGDRAGGSRGGGAARRRPAGRKMRDCAARRRAGPAGAGPRDPAPPGRDRRAFPGVARPRPARRTARAPGPPPAAGRPPRPRAPRGKAPRRRARLPPPLPAPAAPPGCPGRPDRRAIAAGFGAFSARGRPGTAPRPDAGRGLAPPARARQIRRGRSGGRRCRGRRPPRRGAGKAREPRCRGIEGARVGPGPRAGV